MLEPQLTSMMSSFSLKYFFEYIGFSVENEYQGKFRYSCCCDLDVLRLAFGSL